jgi:hypothetical protein
MALFLFLIRKYVSNNFITLMQHWVNTCDVYSVVKLFNNEMGRVKDVD